MKPRHYAAIARAAARAELRARFGLPVVPYKLELITTFACGSRCRTCNIWSRYLEAPELRERELTPEQIGRTVASAREHLRWISLTGGEVTDRDDLVEIVRRIIAAAGDRLALFQVTTNGIEPERVEAAFAEILPIVRPIPTYVTISLDGIGERYERVRGVPDGYAKVKRSMAALDALAERERHLTTGFQITLSPYNLDQIDDLFEDAAAGHERPIVTLATDARVLTRGRLGADLRDAGPSLRDALLRLERRYPRGSLEDLLPRLHLATSRQYFATGRAPLPCAAGVSALSVDPYGGVLQCDSKDEPLARLQEFDFDLVALCRSAAFRADLAPHLGCRDCWTPCHAYPTLMHRPLGAAAGFLRGSLAR